MEAKKRYEEWLENPYFDEETKEELRSIAADEKYGEGARIPVGKGLLPRARLPVLRRAEVL